MEPAYFLQVASTGSCLADYIFVMFSLFHCNPVSFVVLLCAAGRRRALSQSRPTFLVPITTPGCRVSYCTANGPIKLSGNRHQRHSALGAIAWEFDGSVGG